MNEKQKASLFTFLIVFFLFFFLPPASSQTDRSEVRISRIKLKGANAVSKKEIKEKIGTEFPSIKPWVNRPEFDEQTLKDDMARIEKLYSNHGYYGADAEYDLEYDEEKDDVEITIKIVEGKPVILTDLNIKIEGELEEKLKERIFDSPSLKVNEAFSPVKYEETKGAVSGVLADNGYPNAAVEGDALVNRKERWAKVSLSVKPGALYRIGGVLVSGNKSVENYLILREAAIKVGEVYSVTKLNETRARIFGLGLFNSVLIDVDLDEAGNTAEIGIKVEERKLGTAKVGVGFGTEDKLRGQVILTQRNFLGGGRGLELSGKFSFLTQRVEAVFTQPYIAGKASEFKGTFSVRRDDLPSYTSQSIAGAAEVKKNFGRDYSAFGSFNVQISELSDISSATEDFIERNDYFLTFFSAGAERNTTDDFFNPKEGTIATVGVESSLRALGSEVDCLLGAVDLRGYRKFSGVVFAKRISLGVIKPFGGSERFDVPIFKRFFAGGSTSMRGFPFQKLGPLDDNEDPIGGNTLILGSLEARFPIYKKLGGVAFLDYGNVYSKEFDFKLDEIKYALGAGLRYNTVIGPIRLDIGYALNPEPGIERFQFFLSIGHAF